MGMHFGILAVPAKLAELRAVFGDTWPNHEPGRTRSGFASQHELWEWVEANQKFVSSRDWRPDNPGSEVYLFYEDGPWAVMFDRGYVLCTDGGALASLSARFGKALSIVIETTGGTASFEYYEKGASRRSVHYVDGDMRTDGDRLPEERGLAEDTFYMDEVEQLMQAFGLRQIDDAEVTARIEAVELIDRKDYSRSKSRLMQEIGEQMVAAQEQEAAVAKPWWKLW